MIDAIKKFLACGLLALPLAAPAAVYQFNAQLNGASERPTPTSSSATGLATLLYDDSDNSYDFALSAFGLSSAVTGAHIHGQANADEVANVRVNLRISPFAESLPATGLLIGGGNVPAPPGLMPAGNGHPEQSFLAMLRAGLAYINIHTANNTGGEIRGQLLEVAVVPEPVTSALMLCGLGVIAFTLRGRLRWA
jgi:hypothetical protein